MTVPEALWPRGREQDSLINQGLQFLNFLSYEVMLSDITKNAQTDMKLSNVLSKRCTLFLFKCEKTEHICHIVKIFSYLSELHF